MIETVAALIAVLAALVVFGRLLARIAPRAYGQREPGRIRVVDSAPLALKQQIHLVEVDGALVLIGSGESGLVRLGRLPARPASVTPRRDEAPREAVAGSAEPETGAAPDRRRGQTGWLHLLRVSLGASIAGVLAFGLALFVGLVVGASDAFAATAGEASAAVPTLSVSIGGATAPDQISDTLKIVLVLTAISVAPSLLLMTTCFTRILIVLALLRQALGTATLPPNQVLVGLALMTTVYVMSPVGEAVWAEAVEPYSQEKIAGDEALERGIAPVRDYMLRHTRESDLLLFVEMRGDAVPEDEKEVSVATLMPAFMISEMRAAFEIGFMIYLPFLVVDLVIASMLISLGMIMLPPVMIALPFKLMLFVLVDGWNLTLTSLVAGLQ